MGWTSQRLTGNGVGLLQTSPPPPPPPPPSTKCSVYRLAKWIRRGVNGGRWRQSSMETAPARLERMFLLRGRHSWSPMSTTCKVISATSLGRLAVCPITRPIRWRRSWTGNPSPSGSVQSVGLSPRSVSCPLVHRCRRGAGPCFCEPQTVDFGVGSCGVSLVSGRRMCPGTSRRRTLVPSGGN